MSAVTLTCPGNIVTGSAGEAKCVDGSAAPLAWVAVPEFDVSTIDTGTLGGFFAVGFVLVGSVLVMSWCGKGVLRAIRTM